MKMKDVRHGVRMYNIYKYVYKMYIVLHRPELHCDGMAITAIAVTAQPQHQQQRMHIIEWMPAEVQRTPVTRRMVFR